MLTSNIRAEPRTLPRRFFALVYLRGEISRSLRLNALGAAAQRLQPVMLAGGGLCPCCQPQAEAPVHERC